MDLIGQPQAPLNPDVFGLLLQYLPQKSLLKLALACRSFSKDFVWARLQKLHLGKVALQNHNECPMEIVKRISSLPDNVRLSITDLSFHWDGMNQEDVEIFTKFFSRVAPGLVSLRASLGSCNLASISLLDPSKLVFLQLSYCPLQHVIPRLRQGCPKLKELRLEVTEDEWPQLKETLEVVSQWKGHLERLSVSIATFSPPPGYVTPIKLAIAAHLQTLKRVVISCKAYEDTAECFELVYGSWLWDTDAWSNFERNAMESTGLPIHKLRVHGRPLFQVICWSRNTLDDFSSREQIEQLWNMCGETEPETCAKILASALTYGFSSSDGPSPIPHFVFDKTLELINAINWSSPPRKIAFLAVWCYLYLLVDNSEGRNKYLSKFESLVDALQGPDEPLIHFKEKLYFLETNPTIMEQLFTKPRWRQHFSAFFNGSETQRPLVFDFIDLGKPAFPFIASLMDHVDIDLKVTNVEGFSVFDYILRQPGSQSLNSLLDAFCVNYPQVFDRLSLDKLRWILQTFPRPISRHPAERLFRRELLEPAVERDDALIEIYEIYDIWYTESPIPRTDKDYERDKIIEHFVRFFCAAIDNAELCNAEKLKQRLLQLLPEEEEDGDQ